MEEDNLQELKDQFNEIKEKYGLPEFSELNEDFHIEKIAESDTELLVREIRRYMAEKLSNYLRMTETFLHPSNTSMLVFAVVKLLDADDKKNLEETYKKLAKMEVQLIELDVQYNEEKEVAFIKENYEIWQGLKKNILDVVKKIQDNWDKASEVNGGSYFS